MYYILVPKSTRLNSSPNENPSPIMESYTFARHSEERLRDQLEKVLGSFDKKLDDIEKSSKESKEVIEKSSKENKEFFEKSSKENKEAIEKSSKESKEAAIKSIEENNKTRFIVLAAVGLLLSMQPDLRNFISTLSSLIKIL